MKPVVLALALLLVSSCSSQPEAGSATQSAAESSAAASVLDFSGLRDQPMNVEEFVKSCQRISGFNFTYTSATQTALASKSMAFSGDEHVPAAGFPKFLEAQLKRVGFTSERVGPEHLRTFLIQPRSR